MSNAFPDICVLRSLIIRAIWHFLCCLFPLLLLHDTVTLYLKTDNSVTSKHVLYQNYLKYPNKEEGMSWGENKENIKNILTSFLSWCFMRRGWQKIKMQKHLLQKKNSTWGPHNKDQNAPPPIDFCQPRPNNLVYILPSMPFSWHESVPHFFLANNSVSMKWNPAQYQSWLGQLGWVPKGLDAKSETGLMDHLWTFIV